MVMAVYELQLFFHTEIQRSLNRQGPFTLHTNDDVPTQEPGITLHLPNPDDIFEQLKNFAESRKSQQPIPPVIQVAANLTSVRHIPEQRVFSVGGTDGTVHSCRLFPNESCSCPVSTTCHHILAAKRSIGIESSSRRILNLTRLRQNARFLISENFLTVLRFNCNFVRQ